MTSRLGVGGRRKPRVLLVDSDPDRGQTSNVGTRRAKHAGRRPTACAAFPTTWPSCRITTCSCSRTYRRLPSRCARWKSPGRMCKTWGVELIMLGGDQSFGLRGLLQNEPGRDSCRCAVILRRKRKSRSLAMMLVIDKSGSMGGEKIEMAKEAARAAVELLGPSDKIGVLAFEGENFWVCEMHPCSDKEKLRCSRPDRQPRGRGRNGDGSCPAMEGGPRDVEWDRGQAQAHDCSDRWDFGTRRL